MDKLAVYGTLRNGSRKTGIVNGFTLAYPGHKRFPVAIPNKDKKGLVVEVADVDSSELMSYDIYEGVDVGLYERRRVEVDMGDHALDAWMYTIGTLMYNDVGVFEEIEGKDWLNRLT